MYYPFNVELFIKENGELVKEYLKKNTMGLKVPDIIVEQSDFYRNNDQLATFKPGKYEFSLLQKLEYVKCFKDVIYFTQKYGKIISIDDGIIPFKLYPFQKKLLRLYQKNRFVVAAQCRQSGKCVTGDTVIRLRYVKNNDYYIVKGTAKDLHNAHIGNTNKALPNDPKFIEEFDVTDWEIETPTGWVPVSKSYKTVEYDVYEIETDNGLKLSGADTHIVMDSSNNEVFTKDSLGVELSTKHGPSKVISVINTGRREHMYDFTVNSDEHVYYTNDILSHNTQTTTAFVLHFMLFNPTKTIGILANKADQAQEIIERIQLTYELLPFFLKGSVKSYNKRSMKLTNESRVFAGGSGNGGIRGKSLSLVVIDEVAFLRNDMEFYESTYPVISSGKDSRVIMMSTPNGARGLFYKIFTEAKAGKNEYKYIEVPWNQVPGRTEKWKQETIKNTSQEAFDQEQDLKFRGSQGSLLSTSTIESLVVVDPIVVHNENLKIYEEPVQGSRYVMTVDTARGLGGDYSACVVFKVEKSKYDIVATYKDNRISPLLYPSIIHSLSNKYFGAPFLVEINDIGEQVASILYYDYENENILPTYTEKNKQMVGFTRDSRPGVRTTKQVKSIGCSTVKTLIEKGMLSLNSEEVIDEFGTFVAKGQSYEADKDANDDLVMCCVLFAWLTTQQYFKDEMESDSGKTIREQDNTLEDYDLLPFGLIDDGVQVYSPEPIRDIDDFYSGF